MSGKRRSWRASVQRQALEIDPKVQDFLTALRP